MKPVRGQAAPGAREPARAGGRGLIPGRRVLYRFNAPARCAAGTAARRSRAGPGIRTQKAGGWTPPADPTTSPGRATSVSRRRCPWRCANRRSDHRPAPVPRPRRSASRGAWARPASGLVSRRRRRIPRRDRILRQARGYPTHGPGGWGWRRDSRHANSVWAPRSGVAPATGAQAGIDRIRRRPRRCEQKNGPPERAVIARAGGQGGARAADDTDQFWNGVFSAKYSWLSALSSALVGLLIARFLAPACP